MKKLRGKKPSKPEWVFVVHKKPPGLTVLHGRGISRLSQKEIKELMKIHGGELPVTRARDVHVFSEDELRDLMRGYLEKEFYMDVIEVEVGRIEQKPPVPLKGRIPVMQVINLKRYDWLPKYLYPRFLRHVCEALGIIYRPFMLEAVYPVPLTPKAMVEFRPKPFWYKYEKRLEELKTRDKITKSEADEAIEFLRKYKEYEKEKKK